MTKQGKPTKIQCVVVRKATPEESKEFELKLLEVKLDKLKKKWNAVS